MKLTFFKKIFFFILISFLICDCSSKKEIKRLSAQLNCSKKVIFVWDDESNYAKFQKIGNYKDSYASFFKGKRLSFKDIFIESISELNNKYDGQYIYSQKNIGFPSDSIIQVSVKLEKIIWDMGFSKKITDLQLVYSTHDNEFGVVGRSIKNKGKKNYLNCFEDANLQFIIANCRD